MPAATICARGRRRPTTSGTAPALPRIRGMIVAEDVGEFGADDQQPFGVGLGRRDLQQRDQLAGVGQPVLHQAVVAELGQFLDADAGGAQHLDDRPGPERVVFLAGQVAAFPGGRVLGPDPGRRVRGRPGAGQRMPGGGERRRRAWPGGRPRAGPGVAARVGRVRASDRQDGQPFAGPGIHPGLAVPLVLAPVDFLLADRARRHPRAPPGRGPRPPSGPGRGRRPAPGSGTRGS